MNQIGSEWEKHLNNLMTKSRTTFTPETKGTHAAGKKEVLALTLLPNFSLDAVRRID